MDFPYPITSLSISVLGYLAVALESGEMQLFKYEKDGKLEFYEVVNQVICPTASINKIEFNKQGNKLLLCSSDNSTRIFELYLYDVLL